MEMAMAGSIFVKAIIVGNMNVRIAKIHIGSPNVRRRNRKSQQRVLARRDAAFLDAAKAGRQLLVSDNPVLQESLLIDDQIRQPRLTRSLCPVHAKDNAR